jgi:predicted MFS family arabinose efflux permease
MHVPAPPAPTLRMTPPMVALFAVCCGVIVGNIYYAQPIIDLIAPDIGLTSRAASLTVSLTQVGYALGLFFVVPLADLVENRRLLIVMTIVSMISLAIATLVRNPAVFLIVSLLIGFSSVSVQVLVPLAAHFAPDASRGRVVGNVMSGLMLGILLSRPFSSFVADHFGWHAVFGIATGLMIVIAIVFAALMPVRQPDHSASYAELLRSLGTLVLRMPVLRQRAFYQGCMFASFSLFWTAAPLELTRHYGFSQSRIAVFALIGALGAIAAPISGRLADAGYTRIGSGVAMILAVACFWPIAIWPSLGVLGLVATGVLLDFSVQLNMVLGQRAIYALDAQSRGRLNALYMTSIFIGGSIGSAIASPLYAHGGWSIVLTVGSVFPLLALIRFSFTMARTRLR